MSLDSKIKPIFGGPAPGEIDPELIAQAERFMASVRAGEVCAFAIIHVRPNGHPSQSVKYEADTFYALHAGVSAVLAYLTDELKDNWGPAIEPPDEDPDPA